MKLLTTKYAAELNALDIGDHIMISWLKDYKYKGEMRQKVHEFERVERIIHRKNAVYIAWYAEKKHYWTTDSPLPFDGKVAIYDMSQDEE